LLPSPLPFLAPLAEAASEAVAKGHGQRSNSIICKDEKAEAEFHNKFHLNTALCGSLLLLFLFFFFFFLQCYVRYSGYVVSHRCWHSIDDMMWIWMALTNFSWTVIIPVFALHWDYCDSIGYQVIPRGWGEYEF
jgi:hypothetical protein